MQVGKKKSGGWTIVFMVASAVVMQIGGCVAGFEVGGGTRGRSLWRLKRPVLRYLPRYLGTEPRHPLSDEGGT